MSFSNLFFGTTLRAPFSPIILERRQKSLQLISPKLDNSHQNYLDKKYVFDFGVNSPFNSAHTKNFFVTKHLCLASSESFVYYNESFTPLSYSVYFSEVDLCLCFRLANEGQHGQHIQRVRGHRFFPLEAAEKGYTPWHGTVTFHS